VEAFLGCALEQADLDVRLRQLDAELERLLRERRCVLALLEHSLEGLLQELPWGDEALPRAFEVGELGELEPLLVVDDAGLEPFAELLLALARGLRQRVGWHDLDSQVVVLEIDVTPCDALRAAVALEHDLDVGLHLGELPVTAHREAG